MILLGMKGSRMKPTTKQQTAFDTIIECIESNTPVLLTGFAGQAKAQQSQPSLNYLNHKSSLHCHANTQSGGGIVCNV